LRCKLRLAAAGRDAIEREADRRSAAIKETAGALTGIYRQEHSGVIASFDSDLLAAARKLSMKTAG
jgi:hypothetical protein